MSTNTILATTPLVSTNYLLRATGTTIGNSLIWDNGTNVGLSTVSPVSTNLLGSMTIVKSYNSDTPTSTTAQTYYTNQSNLYLFGRNAGLSIISNSTNEEGTIFFGNASTVAYASINTGSGTSSVGGDMNFKVGSNTTRMTITSAGNVGIGTSSPNLSGNTLNLTIVANSTTSGGVLELASFNLTSTTGELGKIEFLGLNGSNTIQSRALIVSNQEGTTTSSNMRFFTMTGGTIGERMRITSGGNVLINKTVDSGERLQVDGAVYSKLNAVTAWALFTDIVPTSGNLYGNVVSFSNSSPNNSASYMYYGGDSSGARFIVRGNGGISNYQGNDTNLSDLRLKKDILPLESYWEKFKAIEIVKFKYIDQTHDDYNIGVIAQQVESVAPEFVDVDGWGLDDKINDGVPLKSIYTEDLHTATIKVLQEAMTKIEEQQAQIQSLQEQINILAK